MTQTKPSPLYNIPKAQVTVVDSGANHLATFEKTLGLKLPVVDYDIPEGERLLIILSHATEEDIKTNSLGNSSQGILCKKLVNQIHKELAVGLRKGMPNIKSVSLINFRDRPFEKLQGSGSDYETPYSKAWVMRLLAYIDDYKPSRILISGEGPFQAILYQSQSHIQDYQDFNNKTEFTQPYLHIGRVYDFVYNGKTIATSFTLPFHWTSTSNPTQVEKASTLIHQQKFHLEYLLYGHNLYTITDKSDWIRKDILTMEQFDDFYIQLTNTPICCIDLETNNLARFANQILTMHFSFDGQTSYNLPFCHKETPFTGDELLRMKAKFKRYFQDAPAALHIFHNAKFDVGVLSAQLNLEFYSHKIYDTVAGTFCLDENVREYNTFQTPPYSLRRVAYQYGCAAYDEGEVRKEDRANMANLPLLEIFEYASKDVIIPFQVRAFQIAEAERRNYYKWSQFVIEQLGAMTLVFVGMENKGILVDKKYLMDLCSNDGIVKKQLDEVAQQFKNSQAAQEVNTILITRSRIIQALKNAKALFKKDLSAVKKYVTVLAKPIRILKKDALSIEVTQNKIHKQELNFSQSEELKKTIDLYETILSALTLILKSIDDSIYNVREYDRHVRESQLLYLMAEINKHISETIRLRAAGFKDYETIVESLADPLEDHNLTTLIDNINIATEQLNSLATFRSLPIDLEKDWEFDISKLECQQLLYFQVLGLQPIAKRKDGGGTVDKEFQAVYAAVPEVSYLTTYNKFEKLMSTYIIGMLKRLEEDADSQLDGRLRAEYGYKDVLTGRSSSRNPNFQNLPSRGDFAKVIKNQFVAAKGEIYIKADYNAAEVRQWANLSGDEKLAATFRKGMIMRRELFLEQNSEQKEALKARIKGEGDVHRLNYSFFFGKEAKDVTEEERTAVKAVIFGVMYGKGPFTLAQDLNVTEGEAQQLLDKLFDTYRVGGDWILSTEKQTHEFLIAESKIGRVRHLASIMHQNPKIVASTVRKICNSITQGFSSDMGYAGGRLLQQVVYQMFNKLGSNLLLFENNTVHDSVEAITKFEHLPISLYIVEHAFTTLMHKKYEALFNMKWIIESEMDAEVGCTVGNVKKLDWWSLEDTVRTNINYSQTQLGYHYAGSEIDDIMHKFKHNYEAMTKLKVFETKKYLEFIKDNPNQIYLNSILLDKEKFHKLRTYLMY